MSEELVDHVDDRDRVVGVVPRARVYELKANFRVAHVFVFDPRGRLLIHELAATKRFARHWGSSVAGGVRSGETPRDAARRELHEELALRPRGLYYVGKARVGDSGVTKFLSLFCTVASPDSIRPNPDEIARVDWVAIDVLRDMQRRRDRAFTPTFASAFALFERGAVA